MVGIQTKNFDIDIDPQVADGKIVTGFVLGDILVQNQAVLLAMHPGEMKERPELGVGIEDMLLDDASPLYWRTKIRDCMEFDKQSVTNVEIKNGNITIDSKYK